MRKLDLTGRRFGKLKVVSELKKRCPTTGGVRWLCKCGCGEEVEANGSDLRGGKITSCGCGRFKEREGKLPPEVKGARWVPLTQDKFALVDAKDYLRVMKYKWTAFPNKRGTIWYASCDRVGRLHRFILNAPPELDVDHRNHDGLDNRRKNLRIATTTQNTQNTRKREGTSSPFKGVTFHGHTRKWYAYIRIDGRQKSLGLYNDQRRAAKAYDKAARRYFGEFAEVNFK